MMSNRWLSGGVIKISSMIVIAVNLLFLLFLIAINEAYSAPVAGQDKKVAKCVFYSADAESIAKAECQQCHQETKVLLEVEGAKHGLLTCRKCHLPDPEIDLGEIKREDILPKCSKCHEKPPHGSDLVDCGSCHSKAHSPRKIPANKSMADGCHVCHEKLNKDVKTFVTQHTELYCTGCHHTNHRYKPDCLECHQLHKGVFPMAGSIVDDTLFFSRCLNCHPPHKVFKVAYPADTPSSVCKNCHRKAGDMLEKNISKHSALQCNRCHPDRHQQIKRCKECHDNPHVKVKLRKFNACGECHGVAHNVIKAFLSSRQVCVNCHVNRTPKFASENNLWIHAPVTKENCTVCHHHHPRSSDVSNPYLLRDKPANLCVKCHSEGLIRMSKSHQQSRNCVECHNPHLGRNKLLLIKDYKEVKRLPKPSAPFPSKKAGK